MKHSPASTFAFLSVVLALCLPLGITPTFAADDATDTSPARPADDGVDEQAEPDDEDTDDPGGLHNDGDTDTDNEDESVDPESADPDDDDDIIADPLSQGAATETDLPPAQALDEKTLFNFLYAEIAGAREQPALSARTLMELARETRDPRIAFRAVQYAFAAKDAQLITNTARLWREIAPNSPKARELMENISAGRDSVFARIQIILARALAQKPEALPANLISLNAALTKADDKEAAQKVIQQLTEPYLTYPEAHFARAQAAALAKRPMEALAAADRALALRPDWLPALLIKAQLLYEAEAAPQARQLFVDAIARQPNNRDLRLAYARSLIATRQFAAAREQFNTLLAAAPADRGLLYTVGMLSAAELDDPATAEPLLKEALAAGHPQADAIRIELGKIASARGKQAEARKWFNAVSPGHFTATARIRSAQSLAKEGKLKQARALLQKVPNADTDTQRRYLLAESQLLLEAKRPSEAYALVDRALTKEPDHQDLLYESAMLAERTGLHGVMEARLRKLIALAPDFAHAYNALGYSFADRGIRLDEAETLIDRALELLPKDPFILDSAGWIRFKRGDLPGALPKLEEAYATRSDPEIAAHLGEVLWRLNRNDEARRILDGALAAHPDNDFLKITVRRLYAPQKKR
ncbi:MAG: tetratricopeptide repeat protein [Azoarcus sp.]|nr:tetratricopeptide repeat protein [Azoarcus sp.]